MRVLVIIIVKKNYSGTQGISQYIQCSSNKYISKLHRLNRIILLFIKNKINLILIIYITKIDLIMFLLKILVKKHKFLFLKVKFFFLKNEKKFKKNRKK